MVFCQMGSSVCFRKPSLFANIPVTIWETVKIDTEGLNLVVKKYSKYCKPHDTLSTGITLVWGNRKMSDRWST